MFSFLLTKPKLATNLYVTNTFNFNMINKQKKSYFFAKSVAN